MKELIFKLKKKQPIFKTVYVKKIIPIPSYLQREFRSNHDTQLDLVTLKNYYRLGD
jgi:hypothetical protein